MSRVTLTIDCEVGNLIAEGKGCEILNSVVYRTFVRNADMNLTIWSVHLQNERYKGLEDGW